MPDPLSIIAIGAAIGGSAGKLAERAWDSSERWLRDRFGSHAPDVQERARMNAAQFVQDLAERVGVLEAQRKIDPERLAETERQPQFSALLQRSLLNAAQTDDPSKLDLLAGLVATRLASEAETTIALASQLASDAIACCTRRQLKLMALCCFLDEVGPRASMPFSGYRKWLEVFLNHFDDFEFVEIDARHLVAIGCATFDRASNRNLGVLLQMKGSCIGRSLDDLPSVEILQISWDLGLAGVFLTSVGSVVGGLALDQILGTPSGPPDWK